MTKRTTFLTSLATVLLCGGLAIPVQAGEETTQKKEPAKEATKKKAEAKAEEKVDAVSPKEVKKFAKAYRKITEIRTETEVKMRAAEDGVEMRRLQTAASAKMSKAVQSTGLELARYNEIANRLTEDEQLRSRIQAALQSLTEEAS